MAGAGFICVPEGNDYEGGAMAGARGTLPPPYIMANFYTDHPEIPAAEKKYFVRKI